MGDGNSCRHLKYIDSHLITEIVAKLENEEIDSYTVQHSGSLDGFMSILYNIELKTKTLNSFKERLLIVKFMRGDPAFRESSKSYIQFANEVFIYGQVLPAYQELLKTVNVTSPTVKDWTPFAFIAKFGYVEGLSSSPSDRECVLVLENLKPLGYQLGPRLYLSRDHLLAMCKPLGEYHALTYAMRLCNPSELERLCGGIVTLPFINDTDPDDARNNIYRVIYRFAFDRFFEFFDRHIESTTFDKESSNNDLKLIECLQRLRTKYFAEPTRLLEQLRTKIETNEEDRHFAAILHGDFNRNNVLFRYKATEEGRGESEQLVEDVKMIDFQELRYGSPAIDLSFFMYMNSSEEIRSVVWEEILRSYHNHMFHTLATVLRSSQIDSIRVEEFLGRYCFEKFVGHFSRFAFYGVMICLHFLPWMLCSEEECARLSDLFESDLHGAEFRKLSIEAGGDEVNMKILNILRHACAMGYMDSL